MVPVAAVVPASTTCPLRATGRCSGWLRRRSERVGPALAQLTWTGEGRTLRSQRCKTDADGQGTGINIPRGPSEQICPVKALPAWLAAAEITAGPRCRKVNRGGHAETARLSTGAVRQILLQRAAVAGVKRALARRVKIGTAIGRRWYRPVPATVLACRFHACPRIGGRDIAWNLHDLWAVV